MRGIQPTEATGKDAAGETSAGPLSMSAAQIPLFAPSRSTQLSGAYASAEYDRWNTVLAEEFFAGRYANQPVYLDLEDEVLQRCSIALGLPPDAAGEALADAVRRTLFLTNTSNLFRTHVQRMQDWDRLGPPPCIALLCLLSLAAERMVSDGEFRQTNYYGRLMQLIGLDPGNPALRDEVARAFREQTVDLWETVNRWMSARSSVRGIPTAQRLGHLRYVGYPISQALIRSADRQALHALFQQRGLEPGQTISTSDMVALLEPWLRSDAPTQALRRIARREGGVARIAEVAVAELRAWPGGTSPATSSNRLALQARLRVHPRPRLLLSLALTTNDPGLVPPGAVAMGDGRYELVDAAEHALAGPIEIALANGARIRREPANVIVLVFEELSHCFREARRLQLGERMMLLAPNTLEERLRTAFHRATLETPRTRPVMELGVRAPGWLVMDRLLLVRNPDRHGLELLGVGAASGEVTLNISGGVALRSRSRWLASRPPRLLASSRQDLTLDITLSQVSDLDDTEELIERVTSTDGIASLSLVDLDLDPGRYVALVTANDGEGTRAFLALETPEMSIPTDEHLSYDLDCALGAISADPNDHMRAASGARVTGAEQDPLHDADRAPLPPDRGALLEPEAGDIPSGCAHHYLKQAASRFTPAQWRCSRCGAIATDEQVTRRALTKRPATGEASDPDVDVPADFDGILEAVSALGSGPWTSLIGLIERVGDGKVDPRRVADGLEELAHIDVARDATTLRPERWQVSRPVIAVAGDLMFLCGWRSEDLVHHVGILASQLGGKLSLRATDDAPSRAVLQRLTPDDAELLAAEASEGLPLPITVAQRTAHLLSDALPTLAEIRAELPPLTPTWGPRTQQLDPTSGHWESAGAAFGRGSFRRDTAAGNVYWHCDGNDCRRVDALLARLLGLAGSGGLLSYDAETRELTVAWRLGTPLPGLFGRTAVLCTGLRPARTGRGLVYRGVPSDVAGHIMRAIQGRSEVSSHVHH